MILAALISLAPHFAFATDIEVRKSSSPAACLKALVSKAFRVDGMENKFVWKTEEVQALNDGSNYYRATAYREKTYEGAMGCPTVDHPAAQPKVIYQKWQDADKSTAQFKIGGTILDAKGESLNLTVEVLADFTKSPRPYGEGTFSQCAIQAIKITNSEPRDIFVQYAPNGGFFDLGSYVNSVPYKIRDRCPN